MKFLKFRYIFTLAIVLVIGITLMVYFFGGLSATALDNSNLEFSYEGYIDYSEYDADGNRYVVYESEAAMNEAIKDLDPATYDKSSTNNIYLVKYKLSSSKIVAQNALYTMFLDEKTTIVSVGVNANYQEATPTEKTKEGFIKYDLNKFGKYRYDTAIKTENSNETKSNLLVRYVGSNAKISSLAFNTFANSVAYEDLLLGQKQRHYSIKFDIENGIEILYEIGDFTVIKSFFPEKFDRTDFFNYFRGNLVFVVNSGEVINNNRLVYDSAYTWSAECAAYLEEKGVATVTPNYSGSTEVDENGEKIPTRYDLTNIFEEDENGKPLNTLKLKAGVDYNPTDINAEGASPCEVNPFANSYVLASLFSNFYGMQQKDEVDPKIEYSTDWRYTTANLSPSFVLRASGAIQNTKMYEYMYKLNTTLEPNFFYENSTQVTINEKNFAEYSKVYSGINIGDKITIKTPVSYFEDLSKVKEGYYNSEDGKFYGEKVFTNELTDLDNYDFFVDKGNYKTYTYAEGAFTEVDKTIPIGGYQAKDENGYLYDEDGNPIQNAFTVELANGQNEKYGKEVEVTPPVFQIGMRFVLTDKGLQTTILNNSIREGLGKDYAEDGKRTKYSHDLKIANIDVLPYITSNSSETSKGQIIIPDGSGAIISFNSPKAALGYTAYSKKIYGLDKAFTFEQTQESHFNKDLMFGMYGFLDQTEEKGVLAIADQGASQTSIYANFKRSTATSKNIAYFTALLRESETVFVGSAKTAFLKWANERSNTDFSYIYQFMAKKDFVDNSGEIQYVTLANQYRDYLIEKYDLYLKDTTDYNVLALNFLGAFEKREVSFGFAHNVDYALTTFEQAQQIVTDLQENGAEEFAVAYKAWTRDSMEPRATNDVKVSSVLGNSKGIKSFKQFLDENEIEFYPEVRVTSNKGYDYSFGNLKYTAKSVGSTYAQHREYDLATRRVNNTVDPITMLSPVYYVDYINGFLKDYNRLGIQSAFLSDIGNVKVGDYSKSRLTYAEKGIGYQNAALEEASNYLSSVMMSSPFDYALKYVDFAVDVPLESTLLGYYDYTIPFYQLVVAGLFDYAGPAVNFDSEKNPNWYLLKALETGSNLQFLLSANDPKILLNTDYTMFYNTYYANWKNEIIKMNNIINEIGIHDVAYLNSHRILRDNVYEVGYSNGIKLIINYTNSYYYDYKTGLSVRPNWFVVTEEAK